MVYSLMASSKLLNYSYIHTCLHTHIATFKTHAQKLFTENPLRHTLCSVLGMQWRMRKAGLGPSRPHIGEWLQSEFSVDKKTYSRDV